MLLLVLVQTLSLSFFLSICELHPMLEEVMDCVTVTERAPSHCTYCTKGPSCASCLAQLGEDVMGCHVMGGMGHAVIQPVPQHSRNLCSAGVQGPAEIPIWILAGDQSERLIEMLWCRWMP